MRRSRRLTPLLIALAVVAAACGGSDATSSTAAPSATPNPANTASGGQIDMTSLEGNDVVLWFWAPW